MQDWEQYVGHQKLSYEGPQPSLFDSKYCLTPRGRCWYLINTTNWKQEVSLACHDNEFDIGAVLTETIDTIGDVVEQEILLSFPEIVINKEQELRSAKTRVAFNTRRGMANTNFENVWWYQGQSNADRPIFVVSYEGKYGIWKHPQFKNYGFKSVK